jgi:hypothetical protein
MKYITLVLLFAASASYAAIPSTTVWELRTTATAGNVNGCGFDSADAAIGTDYSQQDTYQSSGAALSSTNGNVSTAAVTASGYTFNTTNWVGNVIHVTAGTNWTQGWYVIVATDTLGLVLDRAVGTAASLTNGTFYIGGACSMNSTVDDDFFEQLVAGNTVWVKSGTYTMGEQIQMGNDATVAINTNIIGYNTTRNDKPSIDNAPIFNFGANGAQFGDYVNQKYMSYTGTAVTMLTGGAGTTFMNCRFRNTSASAGREAIRTGGTNSIIYSDARSDNGMAVYALGAQSSMIGSFVHDSNNCLGLGGADYGTYVSNIFDNCTSSGVITAAAAISHKFIGNTFYGAETPAGTGVQFTGTTNLYNTLFLNNIFYGWNRAIENGGGAQFDGIYFDNNAWYNNNTNIYGGLTGDSNAITTNPTFTDTANDDFRVGTNMKAQAIPKLFLGSNTTSYMDLGAVQRVEPTGTASGTKGWTWSH